MVALSSGTELVSGSGVLLLGEVGIGLGPNRGFLLLPGLGPLFFGILMGSVGFCCTFGGQLAGSLPLGLLIGLPGPPIVPSSHAVLLAQLSLLPGLGPRFFGILIDSSSFPGWLVWVPSVPF